MNRTLPKKRSLPTCESYHNLVVAIIPARYQSTRFPGKPLISICGKPLIQHTIESVKKCTKVDHVIVATDDERIKEVVHHLGIDVEMTSTACQSGTDRIAEVVTRRKELLDARFIVNVQGDEPCTPEKTLRAIILAMEKTEADIGSPIVRIQNLSEIENPNIVKCVRRLDGFALYFSRSPIPGSKIKNYIGHDFFRHIGIYVFRPKSLIRMAKLQKTPLEVREDLEMLRALESGMTILTEEVQESPPGVDVPEDIEKVTPWIKT